MYKFIELSQEYNALNYLEDGIPLGQSISGWHQPCEGKIGWRQSLDTETTKL